MKDKARHDYLRAMVRAYLECAIWSGLDWDGMESEDDNPEPLDASYSIDDVSCAAYVRAVRDCDDFLGQLRITLLSEYCSASQFGHDFCLTRNGHGAGFWDRGLGRIGDALTERCRPYGSTDLYASDDGKLYWD